MSTKFGSTAGREHPCILCVPTKNRRRSVLAPVGSWARGPVQAAAWGDRVLLQPRSSEQSTKADAHRALIKALKELKVSTSHGQKLKANTLATLKYALRV